MDSAKIDIAAYMTDTGLRARVASRAMARADSATKDRALLAIAAAIRRDRDALINANLSDLHAAQQLGLDEAFVDRLRLTPANIEGMALEK